MGIQLYTHPVSPFGIGIEKILKSFSIPHEVIHIPYSDRRVIVEKTNGAYYRVPLLVDDGVPVWDKTDLGQEIARHLDRKFELGLFPERLEGIQYILARYIEGEIEAVGFKINDIDYESWLPDLYDRVMFVRHKERRFGDGCLKAWAAQEAELLRQFTELLSPLDAMLKASEFLVDSRPRFVDFDLFGILGNFMFSGRQKIPAGLSSLARWHRTMESLKM